MCSRASAPSRSFGRRREPSCQIESGHIPLEWSALVELTRALFVFGVLLANSRAGVEKNELIPRWTRPLLLAGLAVVAVGCLSSPTDLPPAREPASPIVKVSEAPAPTRTPSSVRLWASPSLPDSLLSATTHITHLGELAVEWVEEGEQADVRLEPNSDRPLSRWVYALVAPFPTIQDELPLESLRSAWGTEGGDTAIFLSRLMTHEMVALLGSQPGSSVSFIEQAELLDRTWSLSSELGRSAYAIIPFEQLDPRWKVLRVEGSSPLDRDFNPQQYPLVVSYGLSGDTAVMDLLEEALEWPGTNHDPDKMTVLLMTGVSALVRATAWRMDRYGAGYPGLEIGELLREADITHVSHEVSFSEDCPTPDPSQASLRFCSSPRHLPLFDAIEADLIELSGNHLVDWGPEALLSTLDLYEAHGFETFAGGRDLEAARQPALVEHNGNRLAFVGCNAAGPAYGWASESGPGALPCSDGQIMERVRDLSDEGYSVVFTYQWPESFSPSPLPDQEQAFRAAIDAGADIVNGSQAHRPQSMEFYGDGFIHYGLGNLFFDQMHDPALRQEFLDRHIFYDGRHISTELLTAMLEDFAQPRPMTPAERELLLSEIFAVSGW